MAGEGRYCTPEQMQQWQELRNYVSPEEIEQIEQQWSALIAEVRANRDLDPASPRAQSLAECWEALVAVTFRGNRELMAAVGENYRANRFADRPETPTAEDFAFVRRVNAARQR